MHKLYELKESLCKELENYAGKSISIASLKEIDLFAHAIKNICKIIEAKAMEEYSEGYARAAGGSYRGGSYQGGSYRGGSYAQGGSYRGSYDESMESRWEDPREQSSYDDSYARGRGRGARRDSMGRYSSEGEKHQKVVSELKELQRMSTNELDKEKYDSLIHLVESM